MPSPPFFAPLESTRPSLTCPGLPCSTAGTSAHEASRPDYGTGLLLLPLLLVLVRPDTARLEAPRQRLPSPALLFFLPRRRLFATSHPHRLLPNLSTSSAVATSKLRYRDITTTEKEATLPSQASCIRWATGLQYWRRVPSIQHCSPSDKLVGSFTVPKSQDNRS